MAQTTIAEPLILKKWERNYFKESVRESGFLPYMGPGNTNPIVVKKQLIEGGQIITLPLVSALRGAGKGTGTLVGNEESLFTGAYDIKPYWHRHAVATKKSVHQNSVIDLANASKDMLKVWDMDRMRDGIIDACSVMVESSSVYDELNGHPKQVKFSEATTAQKNTWAAANQTRIVGRSPGILLGGRGFGELQGREFFVAFLHSLAMRDLKADLETINLDGRPRDPDNNPIFQDGDLEVDGVICREIPEISSYGAIGANEMRQAVAAVADALREMGIPSGQPAL